MWGGTITNSTISGNTAGGDGGGLFLEAGPYSEIQLLNSTVTGNTSVRGGGIWSTALYFKQYVCRPIGCYYLILPPGKIVLSRTLLAGNVASLGGVEAMHEDLGGSLTTTANLFGHTGLTTAQALVGVPVAAGNLVATRDGDTPTALEAILDTTLRPNGGPTHTHNLVAGSPAIDAAGASCELTKDQRGAPRPVDGNSDGVAACDIGAVEFGAALWEIQGVGDLDGDGKADVLWRNPGTGEVGGWLLDGLTLTQAAVIAIGTPLDWEIRGVGDLDGDGKADVVWRNLETGKAGGWLLDGLTLKQAAVIAPAVPLIGELVVPH